MREYVSKRLDINIQQRYEELRIFELKKALPNCEKK